MQRDMALGRQGRSPDRRTRQCGTGGADPVDHRPRRGQQSSNWCVRGGAGRLVGAGHPAHDEGITPGLTSLIVPVNPEQSVLALYMTTERAPYVIKRQDGQGPFEREVPWRDGNRTRSAYRHELLRLLIAAVAPPDATVVNMSLRIHHRPATEAEYGHPAVPQRLELILWGGVFFGPPASPVAVLPAHLMTGQADFAPDKPGASPLEPVPITIGFRQRTVGGVLGHVIEPHPL